MEVLIWGNERNRDWEIFDTRDEAMHFIQDQQYIGCDMDEAKIITPKEVTEAKVNRVKLRADHIITLTEYLAKPVATLTALTFTFDEVTDIPAIMGDLITILNNIH